MNPSSLSSSSSLTIIPNFLSLEECQTILDEIKAGVQKVETPVPVSEENSFMMRWGKVFFAGGYGTSKRKMFSGDFVDAFIPSMKRLYYHSLPLQISKIIGKDLYPLPLRGSLNSTVLVYTEEGEFMDWHKDATLYQYNGNKVYTCLICLENTSNQQLCIEEFVQCYDYEVGSLYIFEQFEVNHSIKPKLQKGHQRIMISMTLAEEPYHTTMHGYIWDNGKYLANTVQAPIYFSPANRMIMIAIGIIFFLLLVMIIRFCFRLFQVSRNSIKKNGKKNKITDIKKKEKYE
jgi:hypothetical protein